MVVEPNSDHVGDSWRDCRLRPDLGHSSVYLPAVLRATRHRAPSNNPLQLTDAQRGACACAHALIINCGALPRAARSPARPQLNAVLDGRAEAEVERPDVGVVRG